MKKSTIAIVVLLLLLVLSGVVNILTLVDLDETKSNLKKARNDLYKCNDDLNSCQGILTNLQKDNARDDLRKY